MFKKMPKLGYIFEGSFVNVTDILRRVAPVEVGAAVERIAGPHLDPLVEAGAADHAEADARQHRVVQGVAPARAG